MPFDEGDGDDLGPEWFGGDAPAKKQSNLAERGAATVQRDVWKERIQSLAYALLKADPEYHKPHLTVELVIEPLVTEIAAAISSSLFNTQYAVYAPPQGLTQSEVQEEIDPAIRKAWARFRDFGPSHQREEFSPAAPDLIAAAWVRIVATTDKGVTVRRWDGGWWTWLGTHSVQLSEEDQRAQTGRFIRSDIDLVVIDKQGEKRFKRPNKALLDNVMDALRSELNLPARVKPPLWILDDPSEQPTFDANSTVAVENGLLTLPTRGLQPPSPRFFCLSALKTAFDPNARCLKWGAFLGEVWEDQQSRDTLQEMFGYLLTADTRQQKAFMVVGPPRSGKGTIGRILAALLGADAVSRPALADFGMGFGLEPLIGKSLAIISDARLDGNVPAGVLAERLLAISGEDTINISRKYKEAWNGPLGVRFLLLTNELPRFRDASGALPNRFIVLKMTKTWLGKEDPTLFERLACELPGILNWAIEGWARLQKRGHFVQPEFARDMTDELASIANPLSTFLEEACTVAVDEDVGVTELYRRYVEWCKASESRPSAITIFGRDLRASLPNLRFYRVDSNPRRIKGIGVKFWDSGVSGENNEGNQRGF